MSFSSSCAKARSTYWCANGTGQYPIKPSTTSCHRRETAAGGRFFVSWDGPDVMARSSLSAQAFLGKHGFGEKGIRRGERRVAAAFPRQPELPRRRGLCLRDVVMGHEVLLEGFQSGLILNALRPCALLNFLRLVDAVHDGAISSHIGCPKSTIYPVLSLAGAVLPSFSAKRKKARQQALSDRPQEHGHQAMSGRSNRFRNSMFLTVMSLFHQLAASSYSR